MAVDTTMNNLIAVQIMKKLLLTLLVFMSTTNMFGACPHNNSYNEVPNFSTYYTREKTCFNLVSAESGESNILNNYKHNYFYLYPSGKIEIRVVMRQTSQEFLFYGYYSINSTNNTISITTQDGKPYYFIAPNEYTNVSSSSNQITIVGTIHGIMVKFEYHLYEES